MSKRKQIDAIPDEFAAADEAAEFWDTHDTTDYPRAFRTIRVVAELRNRHYEISIEADVAETLEARARQHWGGGKRASTKLRNGRSSGAATIKDV